jgi:hypothetical protein
MVWTSASYGTSADAFCTRLKEADKEFNSFCKQLMPVLLIKKNRTDSDEYSGESVPEQVYNKKLENAVIQAQKRWLEFCDSCANVWTGKIQGMKRGAQWRSNSASIPAIAAASSALIPFSNNRLATSSFPFSMPIPIPSSFPSIRPSP